MKVTYRLGVDPKHSLVVPEGVEATVLDRAEVCWVRGKHGKVTEVALTLLGEAMVFDEQVLQTTTPALENRAYRLAAFLRDVLYLHYHVDYWDAADVLHSSPEVEGETPAEDAQLTSCRRVVGKSQKIRLRRAVGAFDPHTLSLLVGQLEPLTMYAAAMRLAEPFAKMVQYWKVVDYYFGGQKSRPARAIQDQNISNHVVASDPRFTVEVVTRLQNLRVRCAHPHMDKPQLKHLRLSQIEDVREVVRELPLVQELALCLIKAPPRADAEAAASAPRCD